ncbi:MAG TPA: bifunctional 5,10-methylenetetrahydrofolate dehydrogenase/5,10-methenyltetrahydrofolate cyclohydrolase [Mycobacteriales bacterium]|nr:bifunctional 5,10-methylenetetrahydrofolate dehydrogenase/5,10-methenyltetrahydrofolate cyclohydrolase [Mycobacteriales bacterium]
MSRIDGKAIAAGIRNSLTVAGSPRLSIVLPTKDEGAQWYVRSLVRTAGKLGIEATVVETGADDLAGTLRQLAADPSVDALMCQTPLPAGVPDDIGSLIPVAKDVDGANPESLGRLAAGLPAFAPATAAAVLEILHAQRVPLSGAEVVIVGRSTVVGKPAALLLIAEHATVTVTHTRTRDLAAHTRKADVLIVAAGRAGLIGAEHISPGTVVIDVGTNPTEDGGLIGDVDTAAVEPIAAQITPVPGGVGPVTTAVLMRNVLSARGQRD